MAATGLPALLYGCLGGEARHSLAGTGQGMDLSALLFLEEQCKMPIPHKLEVQ